jgi:hypothetical protein
MTVPPLELSSGGNSLPKVGTQARAPGTAPHESDLVTCSWLFAGTPVYPAVLVLVTPFA